MKLRKFLCLLLIFGLGLGLGFGAWRASYPSQAAAGKVQREKKASKKLQPANALEPQAIQAQFDTLLLEARRAKELGPESRTELTAMLRAWLQVDPVACLNYLDAHDAMGLLDPKLVGKLISRRPGSSIRNLVSAAQGITDRALADKLYTQAFRLNLSATPKEALEMISALPEHLKNSLAGEAFIYVAKTGGADELRKFISANRSHHYTLNALEAVGESDPAGALALFKELGLEKDGPGSFPFAIMAGSLGEKSPNLVLDWLKSHPASEGRDEDLTSLYAEILRKQPARLDELVPLLSSESAHLAAYKEIANDIVSAQPKLAASLIEKLPSTRERADAYWDATLVIGGTDKAMNWIFESASAFDRAKIVPTLQSQWFEEKPAGALAFSLDHMDDMVLRDSMVSQLTDRLPAEGESIKKPLPNLSNSLSTAARARLVAEVAPLLPAEKRAAFLQRLR
jgi:hypothetical protein